MLQQSEPKFDAVTALVQGGRDHQEDAIVADFPLGTDTGIVVLADGMGGHAAGDIASKIVMTEVYSELKFQSTDPVAFTNHLPDILRNSAFAANECVRAHIEENPESMGMGATLVAAVIMGDRLFWISIGDSPLFLFRNGELIQLNEDHSMAPQIDLMAASGMISEEEAREHPDRNALTSVLGGDEIPRIDCPVQGLDLHDGDIVVVASDGLQFLENHEIGAVLDDQCNAGGTAIARTFLKRIAELDDPDQDNTSLAVIKVRLPDMVAASDTEADAEEDPGEEEDVDAVVVDDASSTDNVEVLFGTCRMDAEALFDENGAPIRPRRVSIEGEEVRERPPRVEAQQ